MSFERKKHKCILALNADTSLDHDTATLFSLTREILNPNEMHNGSVNPQRVTIRSAGLYHCVFKVNFGNNGTGLRQILTYHKTAGGATVVAPIATVSGSTGHASYGAALTLNSYFQMSEGDYILPYIYQSSGGPLLIHGASADDPMLTFLKVIQVQ